MGPYRYVKDRKLDVNYSKFTYPDGISRIEIDHGYIDFKIIDDFNHKINEIVWLESHGVYNGLFLIELMQRESPSYAITWGFVHESIRRRFHRNRPDIESIT